MRATRKMEVHFQEIYQRASMTETSAALALGVRIELADGLPEAQGAVTDGPSFSLRASPARAAPRAAPASWPRIRARRPHR